MVASVVSGLEAGRKDAGQISDDAKVKANEALDENSSLSYGAWITQCYLPPETSERPPP